MDLDPALNTFLMEARELLEAMEQGAMHLEFDPGDAEALNAVFRAAHTIKGSAGLFGFDDVVHFTHSVESVLDRVRGGEMVVTTDLIALMLKCCDHMGALVAAATGTGTDDPDAAAALATQGRDLTGRLTSFGAASAIVKGGPADAGQAGGRSSPGPGHDQGALPPGPGPSGDGPQVENENWHISLRFGREVLKNGMDPMSFIGYLATMGEIVQIVTLVDGLPPARDMDPERCYLGFEIALRSSADKAAIEGVFVFVRDECALRILPPRASLSAYAEFIKGLPEEPMQIGEILKACGALTGREIHQALDQQVAEEPRRPVGEILVEQRVVHPETVDAALAKQKEVSERRAQEGRTLRVDADKLDRLINLVGELVIAGASTSLLSRRTGNRDLMESAELMARLVEEIRESALRLRMVQIGETFNRFRRVVRDVSRELGKDIDLQISGGETELDKAVVEKLGDPLLHLVRNSMDHGIEPVEVRVSRGKPEKGTLRLHAYHDSGSVVIEVSDDGGGLNRQKIMKRALERGLVQQGEQLADHEILNLIFKPGFSTAEKVTDLSGRGVGMDVVRRNIEALRGTVELQSEDGQGTLVRTRMPLTLAIIDGFLVGVGESSYVIPLAMVVECVELSDAEQRATSERSYINLRGEVLPFIRLRDVFHVQRRAASRRENVVVVQVAGHKAGLVVDELLGEFQTVIKPLGKIFQHLRGLSGSTVLGSGEVALILDVQAMVQLIIQNENHDVRAQRAAAAGAGRPALAAG